MFGAGLMKKCGLKRGDRIGIILPNCVEFPIIIFGAWKCGVVPSPINPAYTFS